VELLKLGVELAGPKRREGERILPQVAEVAQQAVEAKQLLPPDLTVRLIGEFSRRQYFALCRTLLPMLQGAQLDTAVGYSEFPLFLPPGTCLCLCWRKAMYQGCSASAANI
jgi:hypothetical protein